MALTMAMSSVTRWQPADADVQAARDVYEGPLVQGCDLGLERALRVKLD